MNSMEDYLVRGTAAEGRIRAFAVRSTRDDTHHAGDSPDISERYGRPGPSYDGCSDDGRDDEG